MTKIDSIALKIEKEKQTIVDYVTRIIQRKPAKKKRKESNSPKKSCESC